MDILKLFKEAIRHSDIRYYLMIVVAIAAGFIIYRMGKNNAENKPTLSGIIPEKKPQKLITGKENIQADQVENVSTNNTAGSESPLISGTGDYKSEKSTKNESNSQITTHGDNSPIVTGSNNRINSPDAYNGIKQRHVTAQIVGHVKAIYPAQEKFIQVAPSSGDAEALQYGKEIAQRLIREGYTNVVLQPMSYNGGRATREDIIYLQPHSGEDESSRNLLLVINPASNLSN